MSIFGGDDIEMECSKDDSKNQIICVAKKGNKQAQILAHISSDGSVKTIKTSGSIELQEKIKEYMARNIKIKPKAFSE